VRNAIREAKRALRERVRAVLKQMPRQQRVSASARARALLESRPVWQTARSVLLFAPLPEELDIWPLVASAMAAGKQVALPRFLAPTRSYGASWIVNPETDLQAGHFGVREPRSHCRQVSAGPLDLILVPGLAFDLHGRRLGRGKGYYDRLLGELSGATCGVAFEEQIVKEVPFEPHDVGLHYVLTPNRWVEAKGSIGSAERRCGPSAA
jgi:5-formyltetrahydrofolate cyclo-ligase